MMADLIEGEILPPGEWTPEQAADYITQAWQQAVESIVETGRRLMEAKERVGHGNWLPTIELLPFSERTSQMLTQIAKHPDLSNPNHGADLPPSWRTLSVLAQLPPGEIPKRIQAKEITAELERSTAQQWAGVYQQARQEALNAYSGAVDGLTRALSYAKTYEPPAGLPASHTGPAAFAKRVRELLAIVEKWNVSE